MPWPRELLEAREQRAPDAAALLARGHEQGAHAPGGRLELCEADQAAVALGHDGVERRDHLDEQALGVAEEDGAALRGVVVLLATALDRALDQAQRRARVGERGPADAQARGADDLRVGRHVRDSVTRTVIVES